MLQAQRGSAQCPLTASLQTLEATSAPRGPDDMPILGPSLTAQGGPQRQHGIDLLAIPMHPGSFEASLHHEFVAAFRDARSNRPAISLIVRILHLFFTLAKISHLLW